MKSRRAPVLLLLASVLTMLTGWSGAAPATAAPSAPGALVPLTASRIVDTRVGQGVSTSIAAHSTVSFQVAGRGGVPATGASAVALNVTVTAPGADGFLTVYPGSTSLPNASHLNFRAGQTIANAVVVKIGTDGRVRLHNTSSGHAHVIVDVSGYYLAGSATSPGAFTPLAPSRVLDTRSGNGAPAAPLVGHSAISVQVAGRGGVPANAAAVVLNLTVTSPTQGGFLTAYPYGTRPPDASNVNFRPGQTVPNLAVVKLSGDGRINLLNTSGGRTHVIADVAGYYTSGLPTREGTFVSVDPDRLLDTRDGIGVARAKVPAGGRAKLQISGKDGLPVGAIGAVTLNVTVTNPAAGGFLTVYPSGQAVPSASHLNFGRGQNVPNLVTVKVGSNGAVEFKNTSSGSIDLVADLAGYTLGPVAMKRVSSSTPIQGYNSPTDALAGRAVTWVAPAGIYYVYKNEDGSTNITPTPGTPGVWTNPALYNKRPDTPDPTLTRFSNTFHGWDQDNPYESNGAAVESLGGFWRYPDGKVYLTFAAGYELDTQLSKSILNKLRAKGIKATFYLTGSYLRDNPDLVRRMVADGHVVGSHSMTHPNMVDTMAKGLTPALREYRDWEELYKSIVGRYPEMWKYRPPSGEASTRVIAMAWTLGYRTEMYDVAYKDWDPGAQPSLDSAMERLKQQTQAGSIIQLHTVSTTNVAILDSYVDYCRRQGWEFGQP